MQKVRERELCPEEGKIGQLSTVGQSVGSGTAQLTTSGWASGKVFTWVAKWGHCSQGWTNKEEWAKDNNRSIIHKASRASHEDTHTYKTNYSTTPHTLDMSMRPSGGQRSYEW
ncbi:hypothetical protein SARC_03931 [Sphaeroforma arctica JP610]|uniref:Uncharacterized protein n=1 Tax=Sphaeroforma arctica JP610 TaxID=667725 RepID=A0A0L0G4K0_9EUKA|nr:hypothetical protein SARC_03931 [Sphaeroforma arctica JP610]KNC83824.1 hypothetical protein SARC_03931 [Sphaeroforma arctica JP610]|eukprot:XP_014157726.1 hypothetical protein SARC_03931 [Sphaeroforma arctica JP610]